LIQYITRRVALDSQLKPGTKQREPLSKFHQPEISLGCDSGINQPLPCFYFTLNAAGHILAASAEAASSLGYSPDLLLEQPIHTLFVASEQAKLQAQIDSALYQSKHSQSRYELVCRNSVRLQVILTVQQLQTIDREPMLLLTCKQAQDDALYQQSESCKQVQRLNIELERRVHAQTAELELAFEFEATLKRITDKVRDSLDEHQILQTVVQEMVLAIGAKCCNAALYNYEQGTSTVCYEYTTSISPYQGRVSRLDAFPEIYNRLLQGQSFQFCSLIPNPVRGQVSMLTCPILDDQGVMGDLWLINHAFYAFSEQDIRLVRQVSNQCAIAIRQARLYQAAQVQVQELEKLNRLKDDFLSTVSHELRTPMSTIKMAAQMLEVVLRQEGLLEVKAGRAARYFQILHQECHREISLINDLLDLSQLEARTEPLKPAPIDLKVWLPTVVQPFANRIQRQQQQLQTDLLTELPPLTTNVTSLKRIVTELLDNACKYTPRGGQIAVIAEMTSSSPPDTGSTLLSRAILLSVKNSGVEIPFAEQSRIFDKFYRIPSHDPWQHGGTGMGLALVKELVMRLGATIQVESHLMQTSFTVRFPLSCSLG
jgi:signal transduction histidine kinase/PAS domain-containing protein